MESHSQLIKNEVMSFFREKRIPFESDVDPKKIFYTVTLENFGDIDCEIKFEDNGYVFLAYFKDKISLFSSRKKNAILEFITRLNYRYAFGTFVYFNNTGKVGFQCGDYCGDDLPNMDNFDYQFVFIVRRIYSFDKCVEAIANSNATVDEALKLEIEL